MINTDKDPCRKPCRDLYLLVVSSFYGDILLFFNLGVLYYLGRMGSYIRKSTSAGKKYTRILIPSFIFIVFADVFFIIISLIQGGLFRGWLEKKTLSDDRFARMPEI
jgi:hypothetical protein